jgi:hypothetical protein
MLLMVAWQIQKHLMMNHFFKAVFEVFNSWLKKGSIWEFSVLQKGFRDELLPEIYEIDIKNIIKEKIKIT